MSSRRRLGSYRISICLVALVSVTSTYASAQQVGTCDTGSAQAFLNANNVRAAVYNAGNLFWKGSGNVYTIPKSGHANSIFAANLWIGGLVEGNLRFAGTDYGPFEYFPGPLTEVGELPNPSDCSEYDRIFEVTVRDLERLDATGEATDDIRDWPWHLGAPVADGDGNPDNYDLAAGDRPAITGHQMLWWIMNDAGGDHGWGETLPLGVEVRSSAFAVLSTDTALSNTTFYRYEVSNPQSYAIDSVYAAFWVDPDLGNASDDFVGSDTTLRLGFAYNGDDFDDGSVGYGHPPPAIGFDFVQGPRAEPDGVDNDRDGLVDEDGERLLMTSFMYYHGSATVQGNPHGAEDAYRLMRSLWRDDTHVTLGGSGYGGDTPTDFMFPGDPVAQDFWSEENTDGSGSRNTPSDRRFVVSTGPFRLAPGESEEIVVAIVWARGADRLDSVTELRDADEVVQKTWDAGALGEIEVPAAPETGPTLTSPAHHVSGQPLDVTLRWESQAYMSDYLVETATTSDFSGPSHRTYTTIDTFIDIDSLDAFTDYFWRVRGQSPVNVSPPSETRRFRTSDVALARLGLQTIPGSNEPAFVEVSGPGGADPCGADAVSTDACDETGGNFVYGSENSTGEYVMHSIGTGTEAVIGAFAPHDFEIRFTERGSYAYNAFQPPYPVLWVPFEVWDVGAVGFFSENDPSDDVRLIPVLLSDGQGMCEFAYGEDPNVQDPIGFGWQASDRIYAYYPASNYAEWESTAGTLVDASDNRCYEPPSGDDSEYSDLVDFERGRPLQRIVFYGDPEMATAPAEGTVIRFYTTPPPDHAPILASPASGTGPFDQPLELTWNAARGHTKSEVQVSTDRAFEHVVFEARTSGESFGVSGLDEGVRHYWRVRLSQPEGTWSDVWHFTAGEVTNVGTQPSAELPYELTLEQNYPNPFNPTTTIRFGLPEAGPVNVAVYDVLGRRIATLVDELRSAGWHEASWDASGIASGVYLYTIGTKGQTRTRSMVLMR